jgi:AraC-like DNA-binding protein
LNYGRGMEWRSAADLARSEGDGWYVAPGVVVWRIGGIDGASFWGHVTNAQVEAAFTVARHRAGETSDNPIHAVTDLAGVTSFDDAIYLRMATQLGEFGARLAPRVRRHVVIVPDGVLRAAVVGFLHMHTGHPWSIAADLQDGLGDEIAARIKALVASRRDADLVTALRARLAADTLPEAAKALGVAPRSLQRALHGAGTSFRAIVEEHRIATACRLLDESDLKVESIAREVGFGSLSGFVRSFRRVNGCSPHERRVRLSS